MPLEPVIGLEIHVQLKTKSKMFCSCPNIFGDVEPNSAICPICLGYPGTLPVPNAQAIQWVQLAGAALNCELATQSKFDRKSYFYPDLPKAYQISQYDQPFCGPGKLGEVDITRIHLEEDAAKNTHPAGKNYTLIDYNRAGTPLIEIVTEPNIKSPEQAKAFLQDLQRIVRALGISDAAMEQGQLRCDANISMREAGATELNPKTEVKNLNSFRNVERALTHEISRQTKLIEQGTIPHNATRGFNADTGQTTEQRSKEIAADYRYFPEPDIPPFTFTDEELAEINRSLPELPHDQQARFQKHHSLTDAQAKLITSDPILSQFFENTMSELDQLDNEQLDIKPTDMPQLKKDATNTILRELRDIITDQQLSYDDLKITEANFAELVVLIYQSKVSKNSLKPILAEMQDTGGDPDHIIQNLGLAQVSDSSELTQAVAEVIAANPDVVAKIKAGKESAIQFLMGQVMAATGGRAKADLVIKLLKQKILD